MGEGEAEGEGEGEEEGEEEGGWIGLEDHTATAAATYSASRRGDGLGQGARGGINNKEKGEKEKEGEEKGKGKGKGKKRGGLEDTVGNTPMIRIGSLSEETGCEVWGKVEVSLFFVFFSSLVLFSCLFWFGDLAFGFRLLISLYLVLVFSGMSLSPELKLWGMV